MAEEKTIGITVKKSEDFHSWYEQICLKAEVADFAPVSGTMIIRPRGYMVWQHIVDHFNKEINDKLGVKNAYFPLFIPSRFFEKEKEHAEGFAPEVAWVERKDEKEERIALRPTSETIMYDSYARWIRSYRDLPLRLNQWCNIVRWETKDCKMFLRSREFLWQEGHCVYARADECHKETLLVLDNYEEMMKELLCIAVLKGEKTAAERFAGALHTFTVEGFMPDGKTLQMGTSHDLGQNFAKAFGITFIGKDEEQHYGHQNSWGVSTRLIGAIIMSHSDDKGLVLPPGLCDDKFVIVPIYKDDTKELVFHEAKKLLAGINEQGFFDDRDSYPPGWKFNEWELKGIPLRIEIGPKDIAAKQVIIVPRDTGEKRAVPIDAVCAEITTELGAMKKRLYDKSLHRLATHKKSADTFDSLVSLVNSGNIVSAPFCGEKACEGEIKFESGGITTRCIDEHTSNKNCVKCGKKAAFSVYFGRAY